MSRKVAFITGASRGIGAESAVALARAGFDVAITARTLAGGQEQDYGGRFVGLPGSLEATAAAVEQVGGSALCLQADILHVDSIVDAAKSALSHFGRMDLLFNNAIYQGAGVLADIVDVQPQQVKALFQGNVFTPLALVQALLPALESQKTSSIINMVSYAAFNAPPASATDGGWSFAYSASKAAFAKMVGSLQVEHADSGLRALNLEPGTVISEVMRAAGIDEAVLGRYKPCSPATIGGVVAWLANNTPSPDYQDTNCIRGPALAKHLNLLKAPSLLGDRYE
jgi:NAD(P)-dependent dehydrogenase (short-subunit alcohol dehydrogenase family)